jgi:hypothetical protein
VARDREVGRAGVREFDEIAQNLLHTSRARSPSFQPGNQELAPIQSGARSALRSLG